MDMSKAIIAGLGIHFSDAQFCFDPFHVMKLCAQAIDKVRMQVEKESGGQPKGAMWALRGNPVNLKEEQRQLRDKICKENVRIARCISIRVPCRHVELPNSLVVSNF